MSITKIKGYVRWRPSKRLLIAVLVLLVLLFAGAIYFIAVKPRPVRVSSPDCAALINTARPPTFAKPGDLYNELKSAESYCLSNPKNIEGKYKTIQYQVSLAKVAYVAGDKQSAFAYAHKAADNYAVLSDKEKQAFPDGQTVGITVITLLDKERTSR